MSDLKEALKQLRNASAMFQGVITMAEKMEQFGDIETAERRLVTATKELDAINASIKEARATHESEKGKVTEITKRIAELEINVLSEARANVKPQIDAEQAKLAGLRAESSKAAADLKETLKKNESARAELEETVNRIESIKAKALQELTK